MEFYPHIINLHIYFFELLMRALSKFGHSAKYFSSKKVMYFDYQATTPVDYRVLDAMMPYFT